VGLQGVDSRRREAPLVPATCEASRCSRSTRFASRGQPPPPNRRLLYIKQSLFMPPRTPGCRFPRADGFPKVPATEPPVCIPFADAFQRLLTAHRKPGLCVVCRLPAISAFQHHSTQHLLHYGPPFGFHFCFRSVPSGCVQRSTYWVWRLRLGLTTPGLVGSPHVHISFLVPVSFAGFLIKCIPRWASAAINAVE
jgi:hypothetical protein